MFAVLLNGSGVTDWNDWWCESNICIPSTYIKPAIVSLHRLKFLMLRLLFAYAQLIPVPVYMLHCVFSCELVCTYYQQWISAASVPWSIYMTRSLYKFFIYFYMLLLFLLIKKCISTVSAVLLIMSNDITVTQTIKVFGCAKRNYSLHTLYFLLTPTSAFHKLYSSFSTLGCLPSCSSHSIPVLLQHK